MRANFIFSLNVKANGGPTRFSLSLSLFLSHTHTQLKLSITEFFVSEENSGRTLFKNEVSKEGGV